MTPEVEEALEALELAREMYDQGTTEEQNARMEKARELMIKAGFRRIEIK